MAQPADLLYTKEHEWVKLEGDVAVVGITDYAQSSLGDIVYVELPRVGTQVRQLGPGGVIESVKAVSDVFSPVDGEVVEVNAGLEEDPSKVNQDAFGAGWLFKVRLAGALERGTLLSPEQYDELVAQES